MDCGMKNAQFVDNAARVIAAAYIGALIAGPSPFGWGSAVFLGHMPPSIGVSILLSALVVPWLIAGFLAGRRLGLVAAPIGYFFWQAHFVWESSSDSYKYALAFILIALIPFAFGWMGTLLSSRLAAGKSLEGWHHWRTVGIIALVLGAYTCTIAPGLALHAMQARFSAIWPSDPEKVKAYAAGAYTGVDIRINEWGVPDTCYLDPSGLIFFYKVNLD